MIEYTHPSLDVSMLAPFISLCSTPCSCRYFRPRSTWVIYIAVRDSEKDPNFLITFASEPFSINLVWSMSERQSRMGVQIIS